MGPNRPFFKRNLVSRGTVRHMQGRRKADRRMAVTHPEQAVLTQEEQECIPWEIQPWLGHSRAHSFLCNMLAEAALSMCSFLNPGQLGLPRTPTAHITEVSEHSVQGAQMDTSTSWPLNSQASYWKLNRDHGTAGCSGFSCSVLSQSLSPQADTSELSAQG